MGSRVLYIFLVFYSFGALAENEHSSSATDSQNHSNCSALVTEIQERCRQAPDSHGDREWLEKISADLSLGSCDAASASPQEGLLAKAALWQHQSLIKSLPEKATMLTRFTLLINRIDAELMAEEKLEQRPELIALTEAFAAEALGSPVKALALEIAKLLRYEGHAFSAEGLRALDATLMVELSTVLPLEGVCPYAEKPHAAYSSVIPKSKLTALLTGLSLRQARSRPASERLYAFEEDPGPSKEVGQLMQRLSAEDPSKLEHLHLRNLLAPYVAQRLHDSDHVGPEYYEADAHRSIAQGIVNRAGHHAGIDRFSAGHDPARAVFASPKARLE